MGGGFVSANSVWRNSAEVRIFYLFFGCAAELHRRNNINIIADNYNYVRFRRSEGRTHCSMLMLRAVGRGGFVSANSVRRNSAEVRFFFFFWEAELHRRNQHPWFHRCGGGGGGGFTFTEFRTRYKYGDITTETAQRRIIAYRE